MGPEPPRQCPRPLLVWHGRFLPGPPGLSRGMVAIRDGGGHHVAVGIHQPHNDTFHTKLRGVLDAVAVQVDPNTAPNSGTCNSMSLNRKPHTQINK